MGVGELLERGIDLGRGEPRISGGAQGAEHQGLERVGPVDLGALQAHVERQLVSMRVIAAEEKVSAQA